jgi:hypothetical protein
LGNHHTLLVLHLYLSSFHFLLVCYIQTCTAPPAKNIKLHAQSTSSLRVLCHVSHAEVGVAPDRAGGGLVLASDDLDQGLCQAAGQSGERDNIVEHMNKADVHKRQLTQAAAHMQFTAFIGVCAGLRNSMLVTWRTLSALGVCQTRLGLSFSDTHRRHIDSPVASH